MSTDLVNTATETHDSTVMGPVAADARTAASVSGPLQSIVNRTRWLWQRLEDILGKFAPIASVLPSPVESVDTAANTITITSHGLVNTDPVRLVLIGVATAPSPLDDDTVYYVVNAATDTFKVAQTSGGAAINITGAGSGSIYVVKVNAPAIFVPETAQTAAGNLADVLDGKAELAGDNEFEGPVVFDSTVLCDSSLQVDGSVIGQLTLACDVIPAFSSLGILAVDQTLVLGSLVYSYGAPSASVDVTIPNGTVSGQVITVCSTALNPANNIEFKHTASATISVTFPSGATGRRAWGDLRWNGTDWQAIRYGGGATV